MKPKFLIKSVLLALTLLVSLFISQDLCAQDSPTGTTWDCILSGHRQGTAYLTFFNDFTFSGYEVLVPNHPKPTEVGDARNNGGDATRGGFTTPPADFQPGQQIFGFEPMNGLWGFDNNGRIVGYFAEVSPLENCVTNPFPLFTNIFIFSSPISQTNSPCNEFDFCVTSPVATNTVFDTNIFSGAIPTSGTNMPAENILCVTSTTATNTVTSTSTFTSPMPISETNAVAVNVVCITSPTTTNSVSGTTFSTNAMPFSETNTIAGNIACITLPIGTNVFAIGTNSFTSVTRISETNVFESGSNVVCTTTPIATNAFPQYTNAPFTSPTPFETNIVNADGTMVCITVPTATNDLGGGVTNYTEQETCYTFSYSEQVICYKSEYLEQTTCTTNTYTEQTICSTNTYTQQTICNTTNYTGQTIYYTNIVRCSALTNAISFVGRVVTDKRLTLVATTPFGKTLYRGVPAQELQDISGDWYGVKTQNGVAFQEFFSLSNPFFNIYDVVGAGPGYSYHGVAMLSSRKKISFAFGMDPPLPTDPVTVVRAVTGPFNVRKIEAKTRGYDQPSGVFTNRISFKAARFAP